ncbi:MAG TPA: SHOCT domain-containing protein [Candidatus Limnocylindrales bacterium]|nr:SHOCT domain-containing protein [Candidatus Limnocylindrales bacterium]
MTPDPFPFGGFDGVGGLFVLLIFLAWLIFVGGLITLIVLAIRWLLRNTGDGLHAPDRRPEDTAMATLRERFARGEIDSDEFEQRRRGLGG